MADVNEIDSEQRLNELDRYDLLDTPQEEAFDRITRLVCRLFGVGMSTVTFIDGHRQWFKSRQGVESQETDRRLALCQVPVKEDQPLVVPDTRDDTRFCDNPLVTGAPHLRFYAGIPIRSARGVTIGTLCAMDCKSHAFGAKELEVLADLGKMVETELELRLQAATDGLTQTLSRTAFQMDAERALALAVRHRHDLSCVLFDVDHFKNINDENGHSVGDLVLYQICQTIRTLIRTSDIFGRIGGEEFAIVLPHTGAADAMKVAEKLRTAIAAEPVVHGDRRLQVTASFGVAWFDQPPLDVATLIERADQAMYQAKTRGRNTCFMWQRAEDGPAPVARRVLKAGQIVFNNGRSVIECTVRRLSGEGARIDVVAPEGVPRQFKLGIPTEGFLRDCKIVAQDQKQFQVVFD